MGNTIVKTKEYLDLLDEVYKESSKTAILEGDSTTARLNNHGEIEVAKLDMDGLGDFSRSSGYASGDVSLTWETIKNDKERSNKFKVDRLDDEESFKIASGKLMGEFIRTKVVPETDAARIAKIVGQDGISSKEELLSTGADVIAALRTASNKMDEDEVNPENRILFITPTLHALIDDLDTTKSKAVLSKFSTVIDVPQSRMFTKITLNSGASSFGFKKTPTTYKATTDQAVVSGKRYYTRSGAGTTADPYVYTRVATPATADIASYYEIDELGGIDINFVVVEKSSTVVKLAQFLKYFSPDEDQDGDNHVFPYRNNNLYGYTYENKLAGVYCSYKTY